MQRIAVWGMKCVSYDYGFESDLATKWKTLDHTTPYQSGRTKRLGTHKENHPAPGDSEDEEDVSGEEDDAYHDATGGVPSDQE